MHTAAEDAPALGHLSVRFPKYRELTLHCLSDIHIASDRHQRKALVARLQQVQDGGLNHRLIFHGDLLDMRNKTGKSFAHGAMAPQAELDEAVDLIKPYAEHIDLMLNGNHEWRAEREAGLDMMATIAARVGRPQAYRRGPTIVRYCYGEDKRKGSTIYAAEVLVHHGFGGGTPSGAALSIEKLANWKQDVDAVVMGHNHQNNLRKRVVYTGWPPRKHEQTLVTTGTFTDHDGYAMEMGLAQSWVGAPVIHLGGDAGSRQAIVRASLG